MKLLLSSLLVAMLASQVAFAGDESDHARFRGGIALEGGALLAGNLTLGMGGLQGQLGCQINNLIGVYAVPGFDVIFGNLGGVNFFGAVLVDFTFINSLLTVGVGPDFAVFVVGGGNGTSVSAGAGGGYGGRLHLAINPVVGQGLDPARRKALVIGVDLRVDLGGIASTNTTTSSTSAAASSTVIIAPMLTIGYQAF